MAIRNQLFRNLLAIIFVGAIAGLVIGVIAHSLGLPAATLSGITGGIIGAVGVGLNRKGK
ncbi:MAG TPA: hypothetical protein VNO70_17065 [Blastocatellia bacterium]|nr:hypothetical protein [Blastocatellia bacterium]